MLADRIRVARERCNKTQKEAAAELHLTYTRYNHYETGRSEPDATLLAVFADYFGVTTDYLLRPQPESSETKTEKPPREQRDWVERFLAFAKRKWYLLGWLLIVWGVLDLVQLVLFYLAYRGMISGLTGLIGW